MRGKLIVIEGIDASGKGTQTKLLAERLKKEGYKVEIINFPQYDNWSSIFIKKYLNGDLGKIEDVGPYQCSIFYALDRYIISRKIRQWLEEGYMVICNRYVASNKGHQASKIEDKNERDKFLKWLDKLEYSIFKNPKEDVNVFLDVPPEICQKLVDQKKLRDYLNSDKKRDIHEDNIDYLIKSREAYLELLNKENNWLKVECTENNELLSIEEIHERIWKLVKEVIGK